MPDTFAALCDQIEQADSKSSIFRAADVELRRELIDALIKRSPHTYRAIFDYFNLAGHGISFTAFYYWGRRVRRNAALVEMARTCNAEGDDDPFTLVPRVIAQRLLDACLDEDITIDILDRLSRTYFLVNRVEYLRSRLPRTFANPANPDAPTESPGVPDLITLEKLTSIYGATTNARMAHGSK